MGSVQCALLAVNYRIIEHICIYHRKQLFITFNALLWVFSLISGK